MKAWKTLQKETILTCGKYLQVEYHSLELPDGRLIRDWAWVTSPDFVNVLIEKQDGDFLCFRQYKYGAQGVTLATVGGYIEPDEDPLSAARREVLEETGYTAEEWVPLGIFPLGGNRGFANAHLYLARGAAWQQPPQADDLEEIETVSLSRAELQTAMQTGAFRVLSWTTTVSLALHYLDRQNGKDSGS